MSGWSLAVVTAGPREMVIRVPHADLKLFYLDEITYLRMAAARAQFSEASIEHLRDSPVLAALRVMDELQAGTASLQFVRLAGGEA